MFMDILNVECYTGWCVWLPGVHWLGTTFWMVSQQTDIIRSSTRWKIFNLVLGAIHIFLFLNVKYGQSRCRMAGFYLVCVIYNTTVKYQSEILWSKLYKNSTIGRQTLIWNMGKGNLSSSASVRFSLGHVHRERFPSFGLLVDVYYGVLGYCGNPSCSVL